MEYFKLELLVLIISLRELSTAKPPGQDRKGKREKLPRTSLRKLTTCLDETVDLSQIESPVHQCLERRAQEVQEHIESNVNEKKARKKERRKEKLAMKIRRNCIPECEWNTFSMIPDTKDNNTYSLVDVPDEFLKIFPEEARPTLKARLQKCYNTTSPMTTKERKMRFKQRMCFTNNRLIKCLSRTVRKTCNVNAANTNQSVSTENTNLLKSGTDDYGSSTTDSTKVGAEDGLGLDQEEADDSENLEENASGETSTLKATPSSNSVDTSKTITK